MITNRHMIAGCFLHAKAGAPDSGLGGGRGAMLDFEDPDDPGETFTTKLGVEAGKSGGESDNDDGKSKGKAGELDLDDDPDAQPVKSGKGETIEDEKEDEEDEEDDDDLDQFPSIGKIDPGDDGDEGAGGAFDEKAFDKETAAVLKELEKQGHPGKVYQDLRGKLKLAEKKLAEGSGTSKKVQELEARLAEIEPLAREVEGTREKMKSISKNHARLLVQESDDFVNQVTRPIKDMEALVVEMAKNAGIEDQEIFDVLDEPSVVKQDKMLEALSSKLGIRQTGRVERMADDLRTIRRKEAEMLRNAEAFVKKQREEQQALAEKQAQESLNKFRKQQSEVFNRYARSVPGMTNGEGELTSEGKKALRSVLAIDPDKLSEGDLAFALFSSQSLPLLAKENRALRAELRELRGSSGKKSKNLEGKSSSKTKERKSSVGEDPDAPLGLLDHMRKQTTF